MLCRYLIEFFLGANFLIIQFVEFFYFGWQLDEEPFNPDYVEVDRVLDKSTGVDQNSGEVS